jgi:hypothetical protein
MMMAALVGASALTINAQTPTAQSRPEPQQQQQPRTTGDTTQRAGQNANTQSVTVTGCLKAEKDVPGRRPNAAERAGVTDDYILTNVKMAQGSATSGIGLAAMYEIEGVAEAELQKHLNHQVEITGSLTTGNAMGNRGAAASGTTGATGTTGTAGTTGSTGTAGTTGAARSGGNQAGANADLPELRASSIKMVAATCTAQ